jgi:SAM-dependent methyltransferase
MEEDSSFAAWEQLAEPFAARVETKAHNAYYDRPAVISLLPPVKGKRVLDAGCGPGAYAQWLVQEGADVVGLDSSPRMLEFAQERLKSQALFLQADISKPLDFLETHSFDLVLSALALDYIEDWTSTFKEFFRLLRDPGHLVFSVAHPADEFYVYHPRGNYFATERVCLDWRNFGKTVNMPYFRRPLSAMIDPLIESGFVLERLFEPRPTPAFANEDPHHYQKLMRQPGFICFRARKGR